MQSQFLYGKYTLNLVQSQFLYGKYTPNLVQSQFLYGKYTPNLVQSQFLYGKYTPNLVQSQFLFGKYTPNLVQSQFLSRKYTPNQVLNVISIWKIHQKNNPCYFYSHKQYQKRSQTHYLFWQYHQAKAEYLTDNQICYLTFCQNIKIFLVFCLDNTNKISYLCSTIGQHHFEMVKITRFVTLAKVRGHPISPPTQA